MEGNLINRIMERSVGVTPEVGMGCTICMYSDRHAATIVRISPSGKTLYVQQDDAKVVKGSAHDGSAEYEYTRNPNYRERAFRWTKRGWREGGANGTGLLVGRRDEYYDPHF